MGRHSAGDGASIGFDLTATPAAGSRRAARQAELRAAEAAREAAPIEHAATTEELAPVAETVEVIDADGASTDAAQVAAEAGEPGAEAAEAEVVEVAATEATEPVVDAAAESAPVADVETGDVPVASVAAEPTLAAVRETKQPRFSLFHRSRAAVVAVVAAASGAGAVAATVPAQTADAADTAAFAATTTTGTTVTPTPTATATKISFTVTVDGKERTITTEATTLGAALQDAGIVIDGDDKVSQLVGTPVVEGAKVTMNRVETKTVTEEVTDKYTTTKEDDATLAKGTEEVATKGVDGVTANTYQVTYQDGKEVSRTLQISSVKVERVDEVVKVGTKEEAAADTTATTSTDTTGTTSTDTSATDTATADSSSTAAATTVATSGSAQQIAASMLGSYGWGADQMTCLINLWNRESGWSVTADNPYSSAYGIPQALPGSKMASAGADWRTNAATQIKWGLGYIAGRYGSPCGAWAHSESVGWY